MGNDEKARTRRINIRHLDDMILKAVEGTKIMPVDVNIEDQLDKTGKFSAALEDSVWCMYSFLFALLHPICAGHTKKLLREPVSVNKCSCNRLDISPVHAVVPFRIAKI